MIEVQYFYTGTEALLMKIVFTENRLFKDNFLEKVGGANAPPAPPAPPPMHKLYEIFMRNQSRRRTFLNFSKARDFFSLPQNSVDQAVCWNRYHVLGE